MKTIDLAKRKNLINTLIFALSQVTGLDEESDRLILKAVNLANELSEKTVIERFTNFPWVIKNNPTQPTYYQQVSIKGEVVTLARQGKTSVVNYKQYMKDFTTASEAQVIQHLNYLNLAGRPYLKDEVATTKGIRILDYSPKLKPADADFYCVTLKQGRGCTQYHGSYTQAEKEATRLSKQEKKKAYILGVVGEVEVVPTTTYETKINKY